MNLECRGRGATTDCWVVSRAAGESWLAILRVPPGRTALRGIVFHVEHSAAAGSSPASPPGPRARAAADLVLFEQRSERDLAASTRRVIRALGRSQPGAVASSLIAVSVDLGGKPHRGERALISCATCRATTAGLRGRTARLAGRLPARAAPKGASRSDPAPPLLSSGAPAVACTAPVCDCPHDSAKLGQAEGDAPGCRSVTTRQARRKQEDDAPAGIFSRIHSARGQPRVTRRLRSVTTAGFARKRSPYRRAEGDAPVCDPSQPTALGASGRRRVGCVSVTTHNARGKRETARRSSAAAAPRLWARV